MLATVILHLMSLLLVPITGGFLRPVEKNKSGTNKDYDAAIAFLRQNNKKQNVMANKAALAEFNYEINLTDKNKKAMLDFETKYSEFKLETWKNATRFAWKDFKCKNETIYRWFASLVNLGPAALPNKDFKKFTQLVADMKNVYSTAKVCDKDSLAGPCKLSLDPELTELLKESRDYDELKRIWSEWRAATGKTVKSQFLEYVQLINKAAKLNGYKDAGDMWRTSYGNDTFRKDLKQLWNAIEPFYKQLHAYVRRKLIKQYSNKTIHPTGPIPAHLLGNMWAQNWQNIYSIVKPYPKKKDISDATKGMLKKKMKVLDMFKLSEEFFVSLGLKPMTKEFWNRSIFEKQKDIEMVCHASAWDFSDGKDYRIKMCTRVNMLDLTTVHHEMGHIQYFQQYAHQPKVFRESPNAGFNEALGDVLALSVANFKHLKKIGLLDGVGGEETTINCLMHKALEKLAFVPYSYMLDEWRWNVFSGKIPIKKINSKYWEMRLKYQGVCPPVKRTNDDLDAAAKFHVVSDIPFIRYFVSYIIQFQFHKALCDEAGHEGPLYECDIYQSKKAGNLLQKILKLGSSLPWEKVMKIITKGKTEKMDAQPFLEYFKPLIKWLKKENKDEKIGWRSNRAYSKMCPNIQEF